ncbi:MAG: ribonuclease R, partial [Nitrospinae bacterium]|nr:ribonuclease R [Nitrospinota bacterium]
CRVERFNRGSKRREGSIVRILERGQKTVVGIYEQGINFGYVIPDDKMIFHEIYIPFKYSNKAKKGESVVADITTYPIHNRNPEGRVIEVLGYSTDPDVEIEVIIRKYDIPSRFPTMVIKEAEGCPSSVREKDIKGRIDLRGIKTFTIDGEKARDFDDAVSIEGLNDGGYRLGVHIADVSHYVRAGTYLDKEAFKRGTSVYFPNHVIPMLPPQLSNEICSLKPGEDRLTMSVITDLDKDVGVLGYEIVDTVIRSYERLTYTDVANILINGDKGLIQRYGLLIDDLYLMEELCRKLNKRRMRHGGIDFDLPESDIILDLQGRPEDIVRSERNIAHRMIEEFMLSANERVANHLYMLKVPAIYRIHNRPNQEKMEEFSEFIRSFGYQVKGVSRIKSKGLQILLNQVKGKGEERLINHILLRSMKQAEYSTEEGGHFCLAFDHYTHFTSPIRRYPDLVVHRLIREGRNISSTSKIERSKDLLSEIARHSSHTERMADDAEEEMIALKKVQFMLDKIGERYEGFITGVTSFGLFVELKEIFVEGLVHVTSMKDDYYIYHEKGHSLIGESTRKVFRIGDSVRVKVENVSIEQRKIDFSLIS